MLELLAALLLRLFPWHIVKSAAIAIQRAWQTWRTSRELPNAAPFFHIPPGDVANHLVGRTSTSKPITIKVAGRKGKPLGGVNVTFITDNGKFENGQQKIDVLTGIERIGAARVTLDCLDASPGIANIVAVIQHRNGSIVWRSQVLVRGRVAIPGLTLSLSPGEVRPGEPLVASVTAVDDNAYPVPDGTRIFFVTETENSTLSVATVNGAAETFISTTNEVGIHVVCAYTVAPDINDELRVHNQTAATYVVDWADRNGGPSGTPNVVRS